MLGVSLPDLCGEADACSTGEEVGEMIQRRLRERILPVRGVLVPVVFRGRDRWLTAMVPDDAAIGLVRELILERIYDVRPGRADLDLVVDAGAHAGLFTLIASQDARRVVALEPNLLNFATLSENIGRNDLRNVDVRHVALWRGRGVTRFATSGHSEGGAIAASGAEVTTIGIDDLVSEHGPIDLLKVDVEGAEFEAFEASSSLLSVRTIVAELHYREPARRDELVQKLRGLGFEVEIVPACSLSAVWRIGSVIRNWRRLRGRLSWKLAAVGYLAFSGRGRELPGGLETPLLIAHQPR
jgi:FkbM family methyltransferase